MVNGKDMYSKLSRSKTKSLKKTSENKESRCKQLQFQDGKTKCFNFTKFAQISVSELPDIKLTGTPCGLCDASYIGFTRRHLHQRIEEHRRTNIGRHVNGHNLDTKDPSKHLKCLNNLA